MKNLFFHGRTALRHETTALVVRLGLGLGHGWIRILLLCLMTAVCESAELPVTQTERRSGTNGFVWEPLKVPTDGRVGFQLLGPQTTGIGFSNTLRGDFALTNAVSQNGSGVALGDVDGDGWVDIYFCAIQGTNCLYRNRGGWRFERMDPGPAACVGQHSTGAAFADMDGDGDLDLLVQGIGAGTRLFLNDGKGGWTERADSGLSRTDSGMSLALADIDGDGDLDLYVATYLDMLYLADPTTRLTMGQREGRPAVVRVNGEPATQAPWNDRFAVGADGSVKELGEADGLYLNDGTGRFRAIQNEPGVFLDETGSPIPPGREMGLGVQFHDLNGDGAPDLIVTNDTGDPDRFWLNNGKGQFRAVPRRAIRQASHSSMGLDIADVNRDGLEDVFILDMLASTHQRRLTHPLPSTPQWEEILASESRPLFGRNTLFLGRKDGSYAEVALMAGVAATDWSWSPLFLDVDLDGFEDLLVTTGFEQDVLDADSADSIRLRKWTPEEMRRYRQVHPRWDSPHATFRNRGDGTFESMAGKWGFDRLAVAHGMAMADLDGDGDADVVVNALNDVAGVFRNESTAPRVAVELVGADKNSAGIGARIRLTGGPVDQSQEMIAGGRYLSGDQAMRVFAAGTKPGARLHVEIDWRNGQQSVVTDVPPNHRLKVFQSHAGKGSRAPVVRPVRPIFQDVSEWLGHAHRENVFDDFGLQPLLPWRFSRTGPFVAFHDLNLDGFDDLVVTASKGGRIGILLNQDGKGFQRMESPEMATGDQGGFVAWDDGRGATSLIVSESNAERSPAGNSQLVVFAPSAMKRLDAGPDSIGALTLADVDGDGDLDLFCAGRLRPGHYPESPDSRIWINNAGSLEPSPEWSRPFKEVGMVRSAAACDLNGDGFPDLVLGLEWGPIKAFLNRRTHFEDATVALGLDASPGLWTGVAPVDLDGDGDLDLLAGNWGRNTTYELQPQSRQRIYYGTAAGHEVPMLEAWLDGDQWRPRRDRTWLSRGIPGLDATFLTHHAFAAATLEDVLGEQRTSVRWKEAVVLESSIFWNRGERFERTSLPDPVQRAPVFGIAIADMNGDGIEDAFVSQNFFGESLALSRGDAGQGVWLRGLGEGRVASVDPSESGVAIDGEQRGCAVSDINGDGLVDLVVAQNNGGARLFVNRGDRPGIRVQPDGGVQNPRGIGAMIRWVYKDGTMGPVRWVGAGGGWSSQDSAVPVLGKAKPIHSLWVRWPGGRIQTEPVTGGAREMRVSRR